MNELCRWYSTVFIRLLLCLLTKQNNLPRTNLCAFILDAMLDTDIQELANLTTREGDLENFERLFSKLKEMKGTYWGELPACLF